LSASLGARAWRGTTTALVCCLLALAAGATGRLLPAVGAAAAGTPAPAFVNYEFSPTYQTRDDLNRPNAGEPSVGSDWKTGAAMYMSGTQITKVTFDDGNLPPKAVFKDVTPPQAQPANEDAILFLDHATGRTVEGGLLLAGNNEAYSDDDGTTWNQMAFPVPHSPDHETVGGGPYAAPAPAAAGATGYPNAIYYCSQNVLSTAGAFCGRSDTGGTAFNPSSLVFAGSYCGAIHGHIRVSPKGMVYLPQGSCNGGQGMGISADNGNNWTYSYVPDSVSASGVVDPSVAAGAKETVYYGYCNGDGRPKIAISHDRGTSWAKSIDVGASQGIRNCNFADVITGDDDRAAFAFLGTTTKGDWQGSNFKGVWYMYVAFTYDGGKTWTTVNATPGDPVQRGCIWNGGGSSACRNMLDFNDITVDKAGRVIVAYTDGCTKSASYDCETNPRIDESGCDTTGAGTYSENASFTSTPTCTYGHLSALVRQSCGRGLFAGYDPGFDTACPGGAGPASRAVAAAPAPTPSPAPSPVAPPATGGPQAGAPLPNTGTDPLAVVEPILAAALVLALGGSVARRRSPTTRKTLR
jgi:hypothetical protein